MIKPRKASDKNKPKNSEVLKNSLNVLKKLAKQGDNASVKLLEHYHYIVSVKNATEEQIFDYIIDKKHQSGK